MKRTYRPRHQQDPDKISEQHLGVDANNLIAQELLAMMDGPNIPSCLDAFDIQWLGRLADNVNINRVKLNQYTQNRIQGIWRRLVFLEVVKSINEHPLFKEYAE